MSEPVNIVNERIDESMDGQRRWKQRGREWRIYYRIKGTDRTVGCQMDK